MGTPGLMPMLIGSMIRLPVAERTYEGVHKHGEKKKSHGQFLECFKQRNAVVRRPD
jgi:hypothetical protein